MTSTENRVIREKWIPDQVRNDTALENIMNYKLWFWIVNIFTAFLRLLFIGRAGLTVDEAHYWVYAKFLSLSYFDHPPLIAYIIKLSTLVFGNTEFGVRFPAVAIFFIASFIFYICVKKLYNERTAFFAVLLLNVLPVFSFLGSVISIPDSPLALFWILSARQPRFLGALNIQPSSL